MKIKGFSLSSLFDMEMEKDEATTVDEKPQYVKDATIKTSESAFDNLPRENYNGDGFK